MIGFDIDKIIKEFINSFRQPYQEGLEIKWRAAILR